jgi:soluble lytic murein transglycosylase
MRLFFLIPLYLLGLLACSSQSFNTRTQSSTLSAEEAKNDPEYRLAEAFDSVLRETSDQKSSLNTILTECQKTNPSSLCSTSKRVKTLKNLMAQKTAVYHPPGIKPLSPTAPIFVKNKIQNWTVLRKAPVPNLLKGLLPVNREQLVWVANRANQEKKCPNNVAVATAATLEDYLPEEVSYEMLASLYEKGGNCTKNSPVDREHFLTRAGIFYFLNKNFKNSAAVLSKINPTDAYSGRAAYWLYRSKKQLGDTEGVNRALNRLKTNHKFSFHNLVASHQENRDPIPEFNRNLSFLNRSTKFKQFNLDIQSVETLNRLGFTESRNLVVDWLLTQPKTLEPSLRVYLSQFGDDHAKVIQLPGILMFHAELISKESIELNYPNSFLPLVKNNSHGVNPYLLLAIARRESSFNPKAVSPANAQGLLQLNPETVKALYPDQSYDLLIPETNITLASGYVTKILSEMDGNLPSVLASYNAGEAQVKTWRKRYPSQDWILWIDLIPYRETRDYVANVLNAYHWYRKTYENVSDFGDLIP